MTDTLNDNEGTAPTRAQHLAPRISRPSCHGDGPGETAGPEVPRIALVGAPNVGKSTLFNAITGARRTVGNWPGTTVEVGSGVWPAATDATRGRSSVAARANDADPRCHPDACPSDGDQLMTVLDLPGAYSLDPLSPDEELTRDLLVGPRRPDVVVATVDAAHLARSLYLVAQLVERAVPTVVALTMLDVARRHGLSVDAAALAEAIGCPVIVVDPRRRTGTAALAVQVRRVVRECRSRPGGTGPLGSGSDSVQLTASASACDAAEYGDDLELADARFEWIERAVAASARRERPEGETWSDRLDRVVTAPVLGPLIFL
ncbi:MAG: FeoB small GTPase domain-containing protein, partial [Micrococcales bacterium]|nr:FeoB small GTPase domain-containing protein [Micrococcales bacterium]